MFDKYDEFIGIIEDKLEEVGEEQFEGMGKYERLEFELKKEAKIDILQELAENIRWRKERESHDKR